MNKKFKLLSLTALSLVSVAGISSAIASCSKEDKEKNDTTLSIADQLKGYIDGTASVQDKITFSQGTVIKISTEIQDLEEKAKAVKDDATLKDFATYFNNSVSTGNKLKADIKYIKDTTVSTKYNEISFKSGDYELRISYSVDAKSLKEYAMAILDKGPWDKDPTGSPKPTLEKWDTDEYNAIKFDGTTDIADDNFSDVSGPGKFELADETKNKTYAELNTLFETAGASLRFKTDLAIPDDIKGYKIIVFAPSSSPGKIFLTLKKGNAVVRLGILYKAL